MPKYDDFSGLKNAYQNALSDKLGRSVLNWELYGAQSYESGSNEITLKKTETGVVTSMDQLSESYEQLGFECVGYDPVFSRWLKEVNNMDIRVTLDKTSEKRLSTIVSFNYTNLKDLERAATLKKIL